MNNQMSQSRSHDQMLADARKAIRDGRMRHKAIDEVSLLFGTVEELEAFVEWAKQHPSLEHFNATEDTMDREDKDQSFRVRFEFIRPTDLTKDYAPWRIEAMCVLEGIAPIHETVLQEHGSGAVVHLSWKHTSEEIYESYLRRDVQQMMKNKPGVVTGNPDHFVGAYRNSYGRFSYWGRRPFLKPRVNLRDGDVPIITPTHID